ncbi:MAG: hydrogenase iron-sulfur subunit [Gaiellales bacterium]|nr:MAG: hydrogenase iron-sulfur subunit [Gaiellales bacterium]
MAQDQTITRHFFRPGTGDDGLRPPCEVACPIHTDAQRYIQLVAAGRYADALEVIRDTNALPQSIGRICAHPCEDACRRGQVDEPIAICNIKREASDGAKAEGRGYDPPRPQFGDRKVAIIGSGPSGLAAAHDLALMGIRPVVYERQPEAGGFLRTGILNYRLPKDILDEDIAYITGMGVEIRTGVAIGEDVGFDELAAEHDAVLIAVGLSESRSLPVAGVDNRGVLLAVPFLEAVNAGREVPELGKEIIVIGGGNVAIDVARSARRVSGGDVTMVCLEADHEMPAHDWEVRDAVAEGVKIVCSQGPNAIVGDGQVEGLEMKRCESVFDEQGRFAPTFCETELSTLPGDTVIISIGQMSDMSFLGGSGPELDGRGILVFDREQCATTRRGVFASGEVVTGPGAAVSAMASGKRAAIAIGKFLGVDVDFPAEPRAVNELPGYVAGMINKGARRSVPARPEDERVRDFGEVELGLGEVDGRCEASRCLLCAAGARYSETRCISCLTCVRVCPYAAPEADGNGLLKIDPDKCQACGICFTQCPAKAIDLAVLSEDDIRAAVDAALEGSGEVEFGCWYPQTRVAAEAGAVMLPCTARLSLGLVLYAFEAGAGRVHVAVCSEDDNGRFVTGHRQTRAVVEEGRRALQEIGLDPEALVLTLVKEKKCLKPQQ